MARTPTRTDARENRAHLIEAARAVFRERGPDAEVKEIAARAGVGIGTVYRNFPTKRDLVAAVVKEMLGRLEATIDAAARSADPADAIRVLVRGGLEIDEEYGPLANISSGSPGCIDALPAADLARTHAIDRIAAMLQAGINAGVFREDLDLELAATSVLFALDPRSYQRHRRRLTLHEITAAQVELVLKGIGR